MILRRVPGFASLPSQAGLGASSLCFDAQVDHEKNAAALCPNHHREAHHGERRNDIRSNLLAMLSKIYGK